MQFKLSLEQKIILAASVADPELDPDPQDPHVFGPSRSGSGGSISVRGMDPDPDPILDPSFFS
jgi:hypothetical protein